MTSRRMKRSSHSMAEGTTDINGGDNFPHTPLHVQMDSQVDQIEEDSDNNRKSQDMSNQGLAGDRGSIALLLFLYVLQGIPLGLAGSVPLLLQSRKVSYKDQALFSFVYWPFSVKLLWAPIVDSAFFPRFGRRKTWLVPTQYLIGLFMLVLSGHIPDLMGEGVASSPGAGKPGEGAPVNVFLLTVVFFMLNFLAATQDIAVDGWALTMLSRRNVGWASTCNTVGQTAGYFLGNVLFLALESPDFCNAYLRSTPQPHGLITLAGFTYFWGVVFFVTTTLVMIFTREGNDSDGDDLAIVDAYKQLIRVIRLPNVLKYLGIALTCKIGFAAVDAVTGLKLVEEGVPKEKLALLAVPMVPIQILLPLLISRYTTGPNPLLIWIKAYPARLFMGLVFMLIVWYTPSFRLPSGDFPFHYYVMLVVGYGLHQVALYCMFVSVMSFHAKISDPAIGGTYMTLLNTVTNLGGNWPSTVALWFVDMLTWRTCQNGPGQCESKAQQQSCKDGGGTCLTTLDGYYVEAVICTLIGVIWILLNRNKMKTLQGLGPSAWKCS